MPWTFLSFQAERTVKMQAGHRTKHSGQNVCEMVCYSNVLLCDFFYNFQISRQFRPLYVLTSQGTEPRR
ncbi:unnamed protein product [Staurois parvus]|uniref:Uncharacterized protein n=1 Tax=Staurois parvus TaxID=386267 RepID=A0ABN9ADC8_9NEOB|nr:unnamed protein product [Staurois parvus]